MALAQVSLTLWLSLYLATEYRHYLLPFAASVFQTPDLALMIMWPLPHYPWLLVLLSNWIIYSIYKILEVLSKFAQKGTCSPKLWKCWSYITSYYAKAALVAQVTLSIQLFQFTSSDQSFKPTRQDRMVVWVHYLRKFSDSFNFGQEKCPKIKPSEIFKRPKF